MRHGSKNVTALEIHRMVMQKLPPFMRTWVVEKEQKNERNKPMFQILGPEGLSLEEVRDSTQSITQEPVIVAQILGNGVYRVQLNSKHAGNNFWQCTCENWKVPKGPSK